MDNKECVSSSQPTHPFENENYMDALLWWWPLLQITVCGSCMVAKKIPKYDVDDGDDHDEDDRNSEMDRKIQIELVLYTT